MTDQDLDICRQWFDSVQDTNPGYLKEADYTLAAKLYRQLGLRVPYSVEFLAEEGCSLEKRHPNQLHFVAETQYGVTPGKESSCVRYVPAAMPVVWVTAAASGRPNDQRAQVLETFGHESMLVEFLGDGKRDHVGPLSAICGVEVGGNLTILFKASSVRAQVVR